jgi:hypothetical protein
MIKAYAAMFLGEPHRAAKDYASLKARVGTQIFVAGQKPDPYYTAACCAYKLEFCFRNYKLATKYKSARFHILLAVRILANPGQIPRGNSRDMERFCKTITDILWDSTRADELIARAAGAIDLATEGNFDRDNMRTEAFTGKLLAVLDLLEKQ